MDGFVGPLWVQDVQERVALMGATLGILMRILKFKLHIVRPERLLLYTFIVAQSAVVLAFWGMGMSLNLSSIEGLLIAAGNVTLTMLGASKAIDLGAGSLGLDIQQYDANNRSGNKLTL